jgi:quercetin dioxygenase-like cupin family protein
MIRYPICYVAMGVLFSTSAAMSEQVPDALSVESQGKPPCEKLYEDAQIRTMRCTFPPGAVHVRHSHPADISIVLSGGKAKVEDAQGTRSVEPRTGAFNINPPVSWHEFTNTGDTTISLLIVEKKYEPVAAK